MDTKDLSKVQKDRNIKLEKLEVFKEANSVGIEIFRKKTSNNSVKENLSKAD